MHDVCAVRASLLIIQHIARALAAATQCMMPVLVQPHCGSVSAPKSSRRTLRPMAAANYAANYDETPLPIMPSDQRTMHQHRKIKHARTQTQPVGKTGAMCAGFVERWCSYAQTRDPQNLK